MCMRTAVVIVLFQSIRFESPRIAHISSLVAAAFAMLYRVTFGPTKIEQFMAFRTYWLVILAIFLITTLLCIWRIGDKSPARLKFWCAVMSCYAASAVIDWSIDTKSAWSANTNLWSLALVAILSMWAVKEYLEDHKDREHKREAYPKRKHFVKQNPLNRCHWILPPTHGAALEVPVG